MRADRLIALLLLLQTHGRMSAPQLAAALEVSARTIYRDIDALSAAGVPIYAETGVKGGYALLDSYRTSLTGLHEAELRALFMLTIPQPLADLGVGVDLRGALHKLTAALSPEQRASLTEIRNRVHLDAAWWFQGGESLLHLPVIQQALWQEQQLEIRYFAPGSPNVPVTLVVEPYGLVAKAGVWYIVYAANGRFQAQRVSRLQDVVMLSDLFARDARFDLAAFWAEWCTAVETNRARYPVTIRLQRGHLSHLRHALGELVSADPETDSDTQITLTLQFEYLAEARAKLLGLGGMVEVLAPRALRLSIVDFAAQIASLYAE